MKEGFFDEVVVEGFPIPKFSAQDSNTMDEKLPASVPDATKNDAPSGTGN